MSTRLLRSNHNFTRTPIETLVLEHNNNNCEVTTMVEGDVNFGKNQLDESQDGLDAIDKKQVTSGHDLNDRHLFIVDEKHTSSLQTSLSPIQKFDGLSDVGLWLIGVLKKFELCHLSSVERNDLIPEILTGEALIWYLRNHDRMPTFTSFMKNLLRNYDNKTKTQESTKSSDQMAPQMKSQVGGNDQETIMESLRNQMLWNNLEKLEKFTGKSEQNVFQWIRKIEQTMHAFKMTDDQKLFFISSCLAAEASDWFFDNRHLFPTWTSFMEKFIKIFKPPGTIYVSPDQLCLFAHDIKQNVIKSPSESMKLNETRNNLSEQILGSINQHEFMVHPIQDQRVVPSMVNIVSDSISIVSAEVDLNSFDSQQIPEIKQIGLKIDEELPFNTVEPEQSTIQTHEMDFTSAFAESFNTLIVEKLTTIDSSIKVYSELNESRFLFNKHMRIISCQVINKSQFIRPTTMKIIRIGIDLTINMHREVSKMDWCGNWPFDPGGSVMVEHAFGYTDYPFKGLRYSFVIISDDLFI